MARRRDIRKWLAVGTLACVSLGPLTSGAARAGSVDDPACPGIQSGSGYTTFTAHGSTPFTNAQSGGKGGGTLTWSLGGQTIPWQGFLNVTIDWNEASQPNTTFASDCISLVHGEVGEVQVDTHGTAENLPTVAATGNGSEAHASMTLERVRPKVANLHLQLGPKTGAADWCLTSLAIDRPEAPAPGHKTGNGTRFIDSDFPG